MASDSNLVRRVGQSDSRAFGELLARHSEAVRRHLQRMLRDSSAADDLLQEVFLRLWTRSGQWQGSGSIRPWLLRIATNLTVNYLRSERRRKQRPLHPPPAAVDDSNEDLVPGWMIDASTLSPDQIVELDEQQSLLLGLLDELPAEKREVFRMAHEQEMDIADVADALGIPPGTVKSRLHYTYKRLAQGWRNIQAQWEDQ